MLLGGEKKILTAGYHCERQVSVWSFIFLYKRKKTLSPLIIRVAIPPEFFRSWSQSRETKLLVLKDWALLEAEAAVAQPVGGWSTTLGWLLHKAAHRSLKKIILHMQLHLLSCKLKACRSLFPPGFYKSFEHGWRFSWYSFVTTSLLLSLKVFNPEGKTMEVAYSSHRLM